MWIWEVQNRNARHCTTSWLSFIKRGPVKTVDSKSQTVSADPSSSDLQPVKREQDRSVYIHTTKKQAQPKWLLDQRRVPTLISHLSPAKLASVHPTKNRWLNTDRFPEMLSRFDREFLVISTENVQADILEFLRLSNPAFDSKFGVKVSFHSTSWAPGGQQWSFRVKNTLSSEFCSCFTAC